MTADESRPAKAQLASAWDDQIVPWYVAADVFTAERIVQMSPVGVDLSIDDFRPDFELAQISPSAYGPLLAALCRRGVLLRTDRCRRTHAPSRNGGLVAIYRRPVSPGRHASEAR